MSLADMSVSRVYVADDVVANRSLLRADARTAPIPILICTAHDLTTAEKARLHGQILGIVAKGPSARDGLRGWLAHLSPSRGGAGA